MNSVQNRLTTSFLGFLIFLVLWENWSLLTPTSQAFEQSTVDFRYRNFSSLNHPSNKIVFIDIDDTSLDVISKREGLWPWKRDVWQKTLKILSVGKPNSILFDVLLTEPDSKNLNLDELFAREVLNHPNLTLPIRINSSALPSPARWPATLYRLDLEIENANNLRSSVGTISRPFSPLWENLSHVHVVNSAKDNDGVFRATPMTFSYDSKLYPSLTLKALQMYLGKPKIEIYESNLRLISDEKSIRIPLDQNGNFRFHFYKHDFQTISFESIYKLNELLDSSRLKFYLETRFKDKILIIGSSAKDLKDLKVTPVSQAYPGALLHATAISNILEGHALRNFFLDSKIIFSIFIMTLIFLNFLYTKHIFARNILPVIFLGSYVLITVYAFHVENVQLPLSSPILFGLIFCVDGWLTMLRPLDRSKEKMNFALSSKLNQKQELISFRANEPSTEIESNF